MNFSVIPTRTGYSLFQSSVRTLTTREERLQTCDDAPAGASIAIGIANLSASPIFVSIRDEVRCRLQDFVRVAADHGRRSGFNGFWALGGFAQHYNRFAE